MNIEEYIHEECCIQLLTDNMEKDFDVLNKLCSEYNIVFCEVATEKIFPRMISLNNGSYLIWDMSYWILMDNMFTSYVQYSNSLNPFNNEMVEDSQRCIISNYAAFLSMTLYNYPCISIVFGLENLRLSNECKHMRNSNILSRHMIELNDYLRISKIYCCMHEITHKIIKEDKSQYQSNLKSLCELLEKSISLVKCYDEANFKKSYNYSKEEFLSEIVKIKENPDKCIELMCDLNSFNHTVLYFFSEWKESYDKIKVLDMCLESVHILETINVSLINIRKYWNLLCYNKMVNIVDIVEYTRNTSISRKGLRELLSIMQLVTWLNYSKEDVKKQLELENKSLFVNLLSFKKLPELIIAMFTGNSIATTIFEKSTILEKKLSKDIIEKLRFTCLYHIVKEKK